MNGKKGPPRTAHYLVQVREFQARVLAAVRDGLRREADALVRYANRAQLAVGDAMLAADIHATHVRLSGLADQLDGIGGRTPPGAP